MATEQQGFVIGDKEVAEITIFCEIARVNKSLLTLSDLVQLTAVDATEEDFEKAWKNNRVLDSKFRLESGYVVGRHQSGGADQTQFEDENRWRAQRNASLASGLARLCSGRDVRLIAVSGGNSYKSARRGEDIDLFCVTARDSLWVFMLRSLILARLYGASHKTPPFCFSYVMEEQVARSEFGEPKDALFARDALSAQVLMGGRFYRRLLGSSPWMARFFPRMYSRRKSSEASDREASPSNGLALLNYLLYLTVGSYVRMKAGLLNRRYRTRGETSAVFRPRIGKDHCIYESNRYLKLRRMYASVGGSADT